MKKRISFLLFIELFSGLSLMTSCEKDYYVSFPIPEDISYADDMQPYFDAKCVNCHNGGGIPLNLSSDVSYDNLITGGYVDLANPANSSIYTKVAPGGSMAPYASPENAEMTLKWIEQGALNN